MKLLLVSPWQLFILLPAALIHASPDSSFAGSGSPWPEHMQLGGRLQLKALYRDIFPQDSQWESAGIEVRRFSVDISGNPFPGFRFETSARLEPWARSPRLDEAFAQWEVSPGVTIKGGQYRKPFSMEELTSTKQLSTIEKGVLFNQFLRDQNGYAGFDLGGGVVYAFGNQSFEAGFFNGQSSLSGYADQRVQRNDPGVRTKDFGLRGVWNDAGFFMAEAAVAVKTAEDPEGPFLDLSYHAAYQAGLRLELGRLILSGEAATGDYHSDSYANIGSGGTTFFSFYIMPVFTVSEAGGKKLEAAAKLEALDPAWSFSDKLDYKNDGIFNLYLGVNYFLNQYVSTQAGWSWYQRVTEIERDSHPIHSLEAMCRIGW